jgi:hypothetical protein
MGKGRRDSTPPPKPPKRAPKVIAKADLARRKGVSKSAISKAVLPGGPLEAAHLPNGRIDLDHAATQAWLESDAPEQSAGVPAPAGTPKPEDIDQLGELTLNEIVERYGSLQGFLDYVDARKKIAEIHRLELQNAETEGDLISRDLVRTHVFGMIDAVFRRMLTDTVKTVAGRIFQLVKADGTLEEAEAVAQDLVSATLAPLKTSAARTLRERK